MTMTIRNSWTGTDDKAVLRCLFRMAEGLAVTAGCSENRLGAQG